MIHFLIVRTVLGYNILDVFANITYRHWHKWGDLVSVAKALPQLSTTFAVWYSPLSTTIASPPALRHTRPPEFGQSLQSSESGAYEEECAPKAGLLGEQFQVTGGPTRVKVH